MVAGVIIMVKLNKLDEEVVSVLKDSKAALTLVEIAQKTGQSEKKIFKTLRKLFENEIIDTQNRRYSLRSL
jgi:DNA-binding Lrp family transcriptional regulator